MATEVPVLRADTQKGKTGNTWLLGSALGDIGKRWVAPMRWDRSVEPVCVWMLQ